MPTSRAYSGAPWEKQVAYCRAKRIGNTIAVSGTVAADDEGRPVGRGDVYVQTVHALRKIEKALNELGASLGDVIRTRCYLVEMSRFDDFARGHREVFEGIDPAASAIQVSALVTPDYLVEIEVDAVIDD